MLNGEYDYPLDDIDSNSQLVVDEGLCVPWYWWYNVRQHCTCLERRRSEGENGIKSPISFENMPIKFTSDRWAEASRQ